ncbi:Spb1p-like [Cryptosporidium xiaoi]|uniref:Putative rRNA methyltransferase n=1 Tax=Cryptosporidium xiaoi TaxID=659607 RepID=A0AAV9Y3J7_9CRYT
MGRKVKTGKDRLDRYYHLAKEQGYRARSAFKLIQLAQKFNIFKNCQVLIDLCAAPGGWLQVAKRNMGVSSKIIGVDLVAIKSIPGVTTFKCDITTSRCRKLILDELNGLPVDVILHDGAPNVGTSWDKDAYIQNELVLHSTKLACEILKPNGIFVTKIFRSSDYNSVLWVLSQLFNTVKATKPQSSRNVSAEIFLVCLGYKAPKKIDSKFFDPKYVFQTCDNDNSNTSENCIDKDDENEKLTKKTKKSMKSSLNELLRGIGKRNRDGYEEGDDYRVISVHDFFNSDNPALLLLKSNVINLDMNKVNKNNKLEARYLELILNSTKTTQEIKYLCEDLKVLGKKELMQLLKWRFLLTREIGTIEINDEEDDNRKEGNEYNEDEGSYSEEQEEGIEEKYEDGEDSQDDGMNDELEMMLETQRKRNKAIEKKKKLQERKKEWRTSLSKGGFETTENDPELFKYSKQVLQVLENEERNVSVNKYFPDENSNICDNYLLGEDCKVDDLNKSSLNMILGDGDENEDYLLDHRDKLAIDLDIMDYIRNNTESYEKKESSKLMSSKKESRRKKVISEWVDEMNKFSNVIEEKNRNELENKILSQLSSDEEECTDKSVSTCNETTKKINKETLNEEINSDLKSKRWFSNSAFKDILFCDDDGKDNIKELSDSEIPKLPLSEKKQKKLANKNKKSNKVDKHGNQDKNNTTEIEFVPQELNDNVDTQNRILSYNISNCNTDFELESKSELESESNSESELETKNDCRKPENEEDLKLVQGIGSLLINKSTRMDLIDGSYNRYAFHDPDEDLQNNILGLPKWFIEDENKHNKPELPITKELMKQYREKLREIKNRPIRKESEALARKKRRYDRIMEKARKKAEIIADSNEMSELSKSKSINKLIKKAQKVTSKKRANIYTITRRHGPSKQVKSKERNLNTSNIKTKFVDKRLKKDKRSIKRINKRKHTRR